MTDLKYIPGYGYGSAKLLILSDCPSYFDTVEGKPFSGAPGKELDKILKDVGISRSSTWLTTVSKFSVPPSPKGKKKIPFHVRAQSAGIDLNQQINELQNEINAINPNCILALGSTALYALKGNYNITQFRGSILHGMGKKFIPSYRPSDLLSNETTPEFKGYWNRQIMIFDFNRAVHQSGFSEYVIPQRQLEICRGSWQLAQFRDKYKNNIRMATDIESAGTCIPICVGLSFNKSHGLTVPLWNHDNISSIPTSDMIQCWLILSEMLMNNEIIGQNFNYDRDKLRRLGFTINKLASDLMMKAFAINPELPKNLAFNTSIYTEEPFYKDDGMYEGSINDLLIGCARDACVTIEIDEAMDADLDELQLRPFYEQFLMKLPQMYLEIENNGFVIDEKRQDEIIKKYVSQSESNKYELFKLAGNKEINPNSPKQVSELLFDQFNMPRRDGTGEDELSALLNLQSVTNKDHRRAVELVLETRRVDKTINTYLMALPDYDGRLKTTCFPCLETGRTSNGQQDPPIRPKVDMVGKGNKKDMKVMGMAFQTITKHGDIGSDIREMMLPL